VKKVIVKYIVKDCVGNTFAHRCIHCEEVSRKHIGGRDGQYFQCNNPKLPSPKYLTVTYGEFESHNYLIPEWCPLEEEGK
jgi:hypothetical protein